LGITGCDHGERSGYETAGSLTMIFATTEAWSNWDFYDEQIIEMPDLPCLKNGWA
jgi:hypothetical protein